MTASGRIHLLTALIAFLAVTAGTLLRVRSGQLCEAGPHRPWRSQH
ncbi:MAG TPA: hypothetical protein VIX86_03635 [Streptosporangiaceae bacterium]